MLFLFKTTISSSLASNMQTSGAHELLKMRAIMNRRLLLSLSLLFFASFLPNPNHTHAADNAFGSSRIIEPRLKKQIEEEQRQERERQRRELEEKQKQQSSGRKVYYFGEKEKEKTQEELEFEANKEYMSYWQRFKHSFQYSENFQDIFDLSLKNTTYAPAQVKGAFLNIRSGPGRNYPIIYIAEREEYVDFTAIRTEWYQFRTADGHFGWAYMDDLPETIKFEYENQGFADEAKTIVTRGNPLDMGFSAGIMADDPSINVFIKTINSHFISTELELGASRGAEIRNDFISLNLLAHPFSEFTYRPHFLVGVGKMASEYQFGINPLESESNLYTKAGLGFIKDMGPRMRLRADWAQYSVESDAPQISHFSQLSIGTSFVWGSSTDRILNQSIGERVSITDLEMTVFTGSVNLSNAESVSTTGLRASYHVSEDYFYEVSFSSGSKDYSHISAAIAKNMLTSEYILSWRGKKNFWPTQFFALAGTGLQFIDDDEQVTLSVGAGFRINPLRRLAIRFDGRGHVVQQQVFEGTQSRKYAKNPELSFGLSYFF